MKKFQPMTPAEHLRSLYVQGHDWAQDALEMVETVDSAYDDTERMAEMRALFNLPEGCEAWRVAEKVESLLACAQRLFDETTFPGGVPVVPAARLNDLEDVLPKPPPEPPREIIPCHLTTDT